MFASPTTALVCYGPGWYEVRAAKTPGAAAWKLGQERPDLPLAYCGSLSRLADGVEAMLAGKGAVITVVAFGAGQRRGEF